GRAAARGDATTRYRARTRWTARPPARGRGRSATGPRLQDGTRSGGARRSPRCAWTRGRSAPPARRAHAPPRASSAAGPHRRLEPGRPWGSRRTGPSSAQAQAADEQPQGALVRQAEPRGNERRPTDDVDARGVAIRRRHRRAQLAGARGQRALENDAPFDAEA